MCVCVCLEVKVKVEVDSRSRATMQMLACRSVYVGDMSEHVRWRDSVFPEVFFKVYRCAYEEGGECVCARKLDH